MRSDKTRRAVTVSGEGDAGLSWEIIRAFLALDRHGDYEAAAKMERMDDSTLRRRIRALETRFGRTLFVRNQGRWTVSPDLEGLSAAALRMEEAARSFSPDRSEGAGVVRISILDAFADRFVPVFAKLRSRLPRLVLNVTTESQLVNLEHDHVDIAIRLARPARGMSALRMRAIGDVRLNAYASRSYLARSGARARDAASASHRLLSINTAFAHQDHDLPFADLTWGDFRLQGEIAMKTDSFLILARLCERGLGVAILPTWLAAEHRSLRAVHEDHPGARLKLWLVSRFDLRAGWQRDLTAMLETELASWRQ
jgi:DNA-binding transcriptional LysR family regulator